MKKLFMTLMASMLLLSSTTCAVEMSNTHAPKQMMTMSKADTQKMLSEAGIDASKVSVLDKGEMVKTEGEFWQFLIPIVLGWASSVANAPAVGQQTHGGTTGGYLIQHGW